MKRIDTSSGFFYERHQLSDNLLEPRESREEEEKARDLRDNVHGIGTREGGRVLSDSGRIFVVLLRIASLKRVGISRAAAAVLTPNHGKREQNRDL